MTGSGTATLAAANAYTGPTTVQGGLLVLQGNSQSSSFTAASGGTLQVAGATLNLTYRSLTAQTGGTVDYNGATINGGYLRGQGLHTTIAGNNTFTGVTTYNSTNFQQNAATALTNFTNGGDFANNFPLTWDGGVNASTANFVVSSTANVDNWSNQGGVTVESGGVLNNSQATLVSAEGLITVMAGGQINPAADGGGETLDLHGRCWSTTARSMARRTSISDRWPRAREATVPCMSSRTRVWRRGIRRARSFSTAT